MIKKNTKVIFEDEQGKKSDELIGGMPLTKGEIVHFHQSDSDTVIDYEVVDKTIDYRIEGEDQIVDITYVLRKK